MVQVLCHDGDVFWSCIYGNCAGLQMKPIRFKRGVLFLSENGMQGHGLFIYCLRKKENSRGGAGMFSCWTTS